MKSLLTILAFVLASYAYCDEQINFGVRGEYRLTHPLLSSSTEHQAIVNRLTLLPILVLKKDWLWECKLCTQVPTFQNRGLEIFSDKSGVQKLAIHLELVKNARWADGQPVTIKDVNFTWQALRSLTGSNRQNFVEIDDVIIRPKDGSRFTIISRPGINPLLLLSNFVVISQHIEAPIWEQGHQSWPVYFANSLYLKQAAQPGLYNGPYTISSVSPEKVSLSAVKLGSELSWKTLNVYFFASYQKLFKALETAKVSLVPDLSVWDSVLPFLTSPPAKDASFKTVTSDSYFYEHVDFNLQNPIFQNRNIRKALAYALDKELIQKNLVKGWAVTALSPVHPNYPEFSDKATRYEYDIKKAQKLLEEADWTRTAADQTLKKRSQSFMFELVTVDDDLHLKIAQYLVQAWKVIGAQVTLKALPLSEFRARLSKRRFSGVALYAWELNPLRNPTGLFHSSSIPTLNNHYFGQNISGWSNSRIDPILTKMITTLDDDDRKQFWATFQHEYSEDLPGIPLLFRQRVSFIPKDFTAKELEKLAMWM